MGVAQSFDGPGVVEGALGLARCSGWGELVFALPLEQGAAEEAAVGEHPGVDLQVVERAAVVEHFARFEARVGVDRAELSQQAMSACEAADPPSSQSPGGKPAKYPGAGRRPVALMEETHERNT